MQRIANTLNSLPIPAKIVLSFLVVITIGSLLLNLPITQQHTSDAVYFDHLFTTVSMVCVTGLYTQPVAATYNIFGQIVCMALIKLGGLGLLTIVAAIYIRLGRSVRMRNEVTLQEALSRDQLVDFRTFILSIVKWSTLIELIGTLLLMTHFVAESGWRNGSFTSLFLAISAFNNAGFDNIGTSSLVEYSGVPIVNIVIPFLIIIGGIGFSVWFDLTSSLKKLDLANFWPDLKNLYRKLQLHTRVVLNWTILLLVGGMVFFLLFEWNNPASIGNVNLIDKIQIAWFQSATMRTAGFATISYETIHAVTLILFCVLMFIGGSPGGTAGGTKTSTIALVFQGLKAEINGEENISYQKRNIDKNLFRKAAIVVFMFILLNLLGISLLVIFDEHISFEYLMFESFSALGTVGVSASITPELSRLSQTVLMIQMFLGRIGPITVFAALRLRKRKTQKRKYADGKILIG